MSDEKTKRVTVRITGEIGNKISEVQEITTCASPSEVVRRAISVYHNLVKHKSKGDEPLISVKSEDGEKTIPIFL